MPIKGINAVNTVEINLFNSKKRYIVFLIDFNVLFRLPIQKNYKQNLFPADNIKKENFV